MDHVQHTTSESFILIPQHYYENHEENGLFRGVVPSTQLADTLGNVFTLETRLQISVATALIFPVQLGCIITYLALVSLVHFHPPDIGFSALFCTRMLAAYWFACRVYDSTCPLPRSVLTILSTVDCLNEGK